MKVIRRGKGFRLELGKSSGSVYCHTVNEIARVLEHYYELTPGHSVGDYIMCPLCERVRRDAKKKTVV